MSHESLPAAGLLPPTELEELLPLGGAAGSGVAVSSWRAVAPAFVSKEVEVRSGAREHLVDLSVPGDANPTVCPVTAVVDSGAGSSMITPDIARWLQVAFPDVTVVGDIDRGHPTRAFNGRERPTTKKTCPLRVAFHTE